jgi:hypothetical protein
MSASAIALHRSDRVPSGSPSEMRFPSYGGSRRARRSPSPDRRANPPRGPDRWTRNDVPPGSTRSRWQYHQGMPFCVLTTVVVSPMSGFSCGASCVRPCAFTPRKITSNVPGIAEAAEDFRTNFEVAAVAENAQSALLDRPQMSTSREERDVLTGARHACADITPDSPRLPPPQSKTSSQTGTRDFPPPQSETSSQTGTRDFPPPQSETSSQTGTRDFSRVPSLNSPRPRNRKPHLRPVHATSRPRNRKPHLRPVHATSRPRNQKPHLRPVHATSRPRNRKPHLRPVHATSRPRNRKPHLRPVHATSVAFLRLIAPAPAIGNLISDRYTRLQSRSFA